MSMWSIIIIILSLITAIAAIVLTYFIMKSNSDNEHNYRLYPFEGYYCNSIDMSGNPAPSSAPAPTGCGEQVLKNINNDDIMVCPQGTVINVVGAFFDVYDPLLQCAAAVKSPNDNHTFPLSTASFDCSQPGNTYPYCQNTYPASDSQHAFLNTECGGTNPGGCMMRDASAYLAKQCNGKQVCSNVVINTDFFGPTPCQNIPDPAVSGADTSNFVKLPWVLGNQGISTDQGAQNPVGQTTRQGYHVHGIFACVDPSTQT